MSEMLKIILISFCFITYLSHSQINEDVSKTLVEDFQKLAESKPSDLVYLQTSKGIYETQEDVWFKGYVLDAQSFSPSIKSKTLFIQLIEDKTRKAVWEEKYEIENGFVNGHLYLNDSLQAGSYTLVAYSSYSIYKGTKELHAIRKLQLLKEIKSKPQPEFEKLDSILKFTTFPEGGDLVSGIENRIAFKAENSKRLPIEVSGKLFENNIPIIDFKTMHDGMGSFLFIPNSNNKYHIKLNEAQKDKTYYLSKIISSGKTLQLLDNTNTHLIFKVSQTADFTNETVYLRLQIRGVVYSLAMGALNKELIVKIPLKDIPQGIAEVTLFDKNLNPVAERLVYVNSDRKLNINTILDKSEFLTKEKVVLKIQVTDQNNEPVIAHLGLSVFDVLYQNKLDTKNIFTHYYLSTQLKGTIYNPTYYFNKENKNRYKALDLLLLTQGWRRYMWNDAHLKGYNKQTNSILPDSIVGKVQLERITKKHETEGQKIVMVFTSDSLKGSDIIIPDSKGVFSIYPKHLKIGEEGYVYIKPITPKPKYVIDIKDISFDIINKIRKSTPIIYPFSKEDIKNTNETFILHDEVNKLEEVLVFAKKKQVFRNKYFGVLDSLAKLDINRDFVCSKHHGIQVLNCYQHGRTSDKPVEGRTYEILLGKNQKELDETYNEIYFYGSIRKEYKYPQFTEAELLKKLNLKILKGYYGKREFYQPIYDYETVNAPFPDYRNTLFWKPNIITNEQGEAIIEFYCSDINTVFFGTIEGVSGNSLMGAEIFNFKVSKK